MAFAKDFFDLQRFNRPWSARRGAAEPLIYVASRARAIGITKGLDAMDHPVFLALGRYDFLVAPPLGTASVRHLGT